MVWFMPFLYKAIVFLPTAIKTIDVAIKGGQYYANWAKSRQVLQTDWVMLNFGGVLFKTTKKTLLADSSSLFYDILDEKNPAKADVIQAMKGKPGITATYLFTRTKLKNGKERKTLRYIDHQAERAELDRQKNILTLKSLAWKVEKKDGVATINLDRDPHYFKPVLNFLRYGNFVADAGIDLKGILEEAKFFQVENLVKILHKRGVWDEASTYFKEGKEVTEAMPGVHAEPDPSKK